MSHSRHVSVQVNGQRRRGRELRRRVGRKLRKDVGRGSDDDDGEDGRGCDNKDGDEEGLETVMGMSGECGRLAWPGGTAVDASMEMQAVVGRPHAMPADVVVGHPHAFGRFIAVRTSDYETP
ncbi:hypothetical protein R1sor_016200 [Riccia sorocarpa]|uniref:Uncharacterized protein n=1 Tax=Riccia sorocarpa TaxID=122646 RepID=A0ABD3HIH0_9MARC